MKILAISGSLRQGSHNTDLLRRAAAAAPDGVDVELYHGLKEIPPYDADDDVPGNQPGGRPALQGGARRGRRRADLDPRVQLVDSRRAQERARLGVPAARRVAGPQQAGRGDRPRARACSAASGPRPRPARSSAPSAPGRSRTRSPWRRRDERLADGVDAALLDELRSVVDALADAVEAREPTRVSRLESGSARSRRPCRRARPRAPCARRGCARPRAGRRAQRRARRAAWSYGRYDVSPSTSSVGIRTCSNGGGSRVISP